MCFSRRTNDEDPVKARVMSDARCTTLIPLPPFFPTAHPAAHPTTFALKSATLPAFAPVIYLFSQHNASPSRRTDDSSQRGRRPSSGHPHTSGGGAARRLPVCPDGGPRALATGGTARQPSLGPITARQLRATRRGHGLGDPDRPEPVECRSEPQDRHGRSDRPEPDECRSEPQDRHGRPDLPETDECRSETQDRHKSD